MILREQTFFFRSILTLTLTCIQCFLFLLVLSPHKHHMEWSFSWSWCERNPQSIQEEYFLLPYVHKRSAPGGQEGLVLHECSKIKVNVSI